MGGMKVSDLEFVRLLPAFMRDDEAALALSRSMDRLLGDPCRRLKTIRVWDEIDRLNEAECDDLAWELDVDWYDSAGMSLEEKRAVLKTAQQIKRRRGTKWAVEELAENVFGSGKVEEWFEYGGKPYCFRVATDAHMDEARMSEFYAMIARVKNTRSHLDALEFERNLAQNLYFCGVCTAEARADVGYNAEALAYRGGLKQNLYSCGVCTAECRAEVAQGPPSYQFEVREDGHLWVLTDAAGGSAGFRISADGHLMADTDAVPDAGMYRIREDGHLVYGSSAGQEQDGTGHDGAAGQEEAVRQDGGAGLEDI